jgi:uncharacterized membrane protein YhhN
MTIIAWTFTIGIILDIIFIISFYKAQYKRVLFFKTISSLLFLCIGLFCTLNYQDHFLSWLIVGGLGFGVIGDFFLDADMVFPALQKKSFMLGCGAFFIGHLFYIARSMIYIAQSGQWMLVLYALFGCAVGGVIIHQMFKVVFPPADVKVTGVLYLLVLDLSCFLAAGLWLSGIGSAWMAWGTMLFAISDHMLVYDYFGIKKIVWFHAVLLILYYLAQCMIALSILG